MPRHPGPAFGRPKCRLVPGIHAFMYDGQGVDSWDKPDHDDGQAKKQVKKQAKINS